MVFTRDGEQNRDFDSRTFLTNAVLRKLHLYVVSKRELSSTALSGFNRFFFILRHVHEFLVMIESVILEIQAAEM